MFALVDCNCFYVSCERLFRPELEGRATVVLSGREGCIVSCSPEAKALGARVGDPWFLARSRPGLGEAAAVVANFELYGDMSQRVMSALSRFGLPMEAYSIDEAFLRLPARMGPAQRADWAARARADCLAVGIPVSIGIGSTKTLAKLANGWAKPADGGSGAMDIEAWSLSDPAALAQALARTPCSAVWGVGPRSAEKLSAQSISTVDQLVAADVEALRKIGTVTLARAGQELRGEPRYAVEERPAAAQSLMRTRTFERPMGSRQELGEAMAHFTQAACFQLRCMGLLAGKAEVSIGTHPMDRRNVARQATQKIVLSPPTNDSLALGVAVSQALGLCFKPGYAYRRAGICLSDLRPDPARPRVEREPTPPQDYPLLDQPDGGWEPLPHAAAPKARGAGLMAALDEINAKFGSGTLRMAKARVPVSGAPRAHPTTRLDEVPVARAD